MMKKLSVWVLALLIVSSLMMSSMAEGLIIESDWTEGQAVAAADVLDEIEDENIMSKIVESAISETEEDLPTEKPGQYVDFTGEATVSAAKNVAIDKTYFPDETFRKSVMVNWDTDGDGVLSVDEREAVTDIHVEPDYYGEVTVTSLKGIEWFPNLEYLSCNLEQLTSLDVSHNTALKYLACDNNQLTSLDLSKNTALVDLFCNNNQLTSLDVSHNTKLDSLSCGSNKISTIDISNCANLIDVAKTHPETDYDNTISFYGRGVLHIDPSTSVTANGKVLYGGVTVTLSTKSIKLSEKETYKLTAKVKPTDKAKSLRYKSSNAKIATVDAKTGKITAKAAGGAVIKAVIGSKTLATCKVTVKKAPETVTLNKTKVTLERGKTIQLKATPNEGTYTSRFTWTSSNKKVAKVNSKGKVTAVGKGTATITVKATNGKRATCKVTVKAKIIDLAAYVGKNLKDTAKKLSLKYNGHGYGNTFVWMEDVREYASSECASFIAIEKKNAKYCIAGVTYGMSIDKADNTLKTNKWKKTETDKSNDFVHHYYYQNSNGNEIDLYVYEPGTNKNVSMIVIRQSKNERWSEL